MDFELETVDLPNQELFKCGTYRGRTYEEEDLDIIVSSYEEMPHFNRPVKLGHEGGFMPAVGWVKNIRRVGKSLMGDYKDVPKVVAELIKKKGYHTTSPEIYHNFTDHRTGKVYKHAYRAQALLGAEIPEIKDLNSIVALYSEDVMEGDDWEVIEGFAEEAMSYEELRRRISAELSGSMYVEETFPNYVIVSDYDGNGQVFWKISYSVLDGEIKLGEQVEVQKQTSYISKYEEELEEIEGRAKQLRTILNEEGGDEFMERTQLIESLGLASDASDDVILSAIQGLKTKAETPPATVDTEHFMDTRSAEFLALKQKAEEGSQALAELFSERKEQFLKQAIRDGKFDPAEYEAWSEDYDKDPELVKRMINRLPVQEKFSELIREKGSGGGGESEPSDFVKGLEKFQEEHPELSWSESYDAYRKTLAGPVKEVRE